MPQTHIHDGITGTMGGTPLIRLRHLDNGLPGRIALKHEGFNPFSSGSITWAALQVAARPRTRAG